MKTNHKLKKVTENQYNVHYLLPAVLLLIFSFQFHLLLPYNPFLPVSFLRLHRTSYNLLSYKTTPPPPPPSPTTTITTTTATNTNTFNATIFTTKLTLCRTHTEVLIRIKKVGLCGTDMSMVYKGKTADLQVAFPTGVGHEASGIVSRCGKNVTHLKTGE